MALPCGPLRAACLWTGTLLRQWPRKIPPSAAGAAALLRPPVNPCMSSNVRHLSALCAPLPRSTQSAFLPAARRLAPAQSCPILSRVTPLLPSILHQPSRTVTYFGLRRGKRKTVRAVTQRFMRLHSGLWIRRKAGYKKKLWKKKASRKKRLREIVFCNKTQSKLLDKMTTQFWKRRNWWCSPGRGVMALPCVRLGAAHLRSGALLRCLRWSSSHQASTEASEEIDIPRRKTWDKTAVLQALAYTVNHDPTASPYKFQDDPYLIPSTSTDYKLYSMSKESGKIAAKYIVNMHPNLFQRDIAEPHIPCLMPENIQPQIESVSEEALIERIKLRRVKESVDLFDQLLQGGTTPSLETTNKLLDLICFYGDREPTEDDQQSPQEENETENVKKRNYFQKSLPAGKTWRENNNAERIFNLMPERDAHSYCTMIRGMGKHGASAQAFSLYTDLLNNRFTGDVYTFNALILAAPETKKEVKEKSAVIVELLNHMAQQKVTPNLLTFNSILKSLRRIGPAVKGMAMQTLMEMKALHIEPSLATYNHLLGVYYRAGDLLGQSQLLASILEQAQGKSFTAKDPDDVFFFSEAMKVCLEAKDLDLAYELHKLLNTGDNWRLIGNTSLEFAYYGKFFNIVCMMENADMVLKWYRELVPSRYYPTSKGFQNLLQVLEMENRLELIPDLWKDIKQIGHSNKEYLLEEVLNLMASGKPNAELQAAFADTAVSIKSTYESSVNSKNPLKESASAFGNIAILLTRAGRLEEAWKILNSFKAKHLVPRSNVITELLDGAKAAGNRAVAVDLVQLAVGYSLPDTPQIAQKVLNDFTLTEEQRITLQDLTQSSSTSSSSSSDSDRD